MTAYRDEREALLNQVQLLERALGKERGEREAAVEERERLEQELAAVRRELARIHGLIELPTQARWAAVAAVLALAALSSLFVGGRAGCPRARSAQAVSAAPLASVVALPSLTDLPPPPPFPPTLELSPPARNDVTTQEVREEPRRSEVHDTLRASRDRIRSCLGPRTGRAFVRIVFSGETGQVIAARLTPPSDLRDPRAERCIVREVERARVEPFTRPSLTVTYPFVF